MTDIVERLRNYSTCSDNDVDEAASEIERLRKQLGNYRAAFEAADYYIDRLAKYDDEIPVRDMDEACCAYVTAKRALASDQVTK